MNYGNKTSAEYLRDYGMIFLNNNDDKYELEIPESFLSQVQGLEAKVNILQSNMLPARLDLCVIVLKKENFQYRRQNFLEN